MKTQQLIGRLVFGVAILCGMVSTSCAQLILDGKPNVDDGRLHAWYDAADFLGFDGDAATPIWPNRQGDENRAIWNAFGPSDESDIVFSSVNNNTIPAVGFIDAVAWAEAGDFGTVEDGFTVLVVARVDDPAYAYLFTGNQGGGGAEVNANFAAEEPDTWTMKGNDGLRISTAPVVADELQFHTFIFGEDEIGTHYLNGQLVGSGEIGYASLDGFVLGGRQNGGQRAYVTFAEVLIYDEALEDPDRRILERYIDDKYFSTVIAGDFDGDGELSAGDIDLLSAEVRSGQYDSQYDLNVDGEVDQLDREMWIVELKNTYVGDANLDGEFNTSDFVAAFQYGQYEDAIDGNSTWESGDWDGDGDFKSGDFVAAFQAGGYEQGVRAAVAVPEPSTLIMSLAGILTLCGYRRR